MHVTLVGAIKLSVEGVAESIISKYSIHNGKTRPIKDEAVNDEMFVDVNGPQLGEADEMLSKAFDMKFNGH